VSDVVRTGLAFAITSAFCFGLAGATASAMFDAGWSAGAAVAVRVGLGAVVLAGPAVFALRGRWAAVRAQARLLLAYGILAVAGAQLCYFYAVSYLPVGVALLIEYTSPVGVVVWMWARHRQAPTRLTLVGGVIALVGLALLIDAFGSETSLDPRGVAWALAAMVGATAYFVISGHGDSGVPPVALAWFGLTTATVTVGVVGMTGALPLHAATADVTYRGVSVPWLLPIVALGVVTAALAYLTGVAGVRRLGARLASFVGLTEVLAAVLFAWLLIAELPTPLQWLGGVLVLAGVVIVKWGEPEPAPEAALPTV
jgi:drug/metabolite transporter (DMT)-like permease